MIKTKNVSYIYEDGTQALKNVNIDLNKGRIIGLMGENGAGKSTLFNVVMGIFKPQKGELIFNESEVSYSKSDIRKYRRNLGMVFQDPDKQIFHTSVYEDVAFVLHNLGLEKELIIEKTNKAMETCGITDLKSKPIHFLSYGQKKRVALAGAIVNECKVLLLDEPTAGLDPSMVKKIKKILLRLSENTIIFISSHDIDFMYDICDYAYVLKKGSIIYEGDKEDVFSKEELLTSTDLELPWKVKIQKYLDEHEVITRDDFDLNFK